MRYLEPDISALMRDPTITEEIHITVTRFSSGSGGTNKPIYVDQGVSRALYRPADHPFQLTKDHGYIYYGHSVFWLPASDTVCNLLNEYNLSRGYTYIKRTSTIPKPLIRDLEARGLTMAHLGSLNAHRVRNFSDYGGYIIVRAIYPDGPFTESIKFE